MVMAMIKEKQRRKPGELHREEAGRRKDSVGRDGD